MSSFVSRARGDGWHTLGGVVFGRISRIYRGERPPLLWVLLGQGLRADKGVSGALFHPGVCGVGEVEEEWEGGSAGLSMLILLASLVFSPLVVFDQG